MILNRLKNKQFFLEIQIYKKFKLTNFKKDDACVSETETHASAFHGKPEHAGLPPLYGILCPLTKTAHCSFALEKHNDI